MDAIDVVRAELAAQGAVIAQVQQAQTRLELDVHHAFQSVHANLAGLEAKFAASDAVYSSQLNYLKTVVFSLTNQMAMVSATLGSAIDALKRGDANASSQALHDALAMQDQLGHMIDTHLRLVE